MPQYDIFRKNCIRIFGFRLTIPMCVISIVFLMHKGKERLQQYNQLQQITLPLLLRQLATWLET